MKRSLVFTFLFGCFVLMSLSFSSCEKKQNAIPDFPQLLGTWKGETSQGSSVMMGVTDIKGTLYINQYDMMIYTVGGYQEYKAGSSDGLAAIINKQFKIHLGTGTAGESYIDGTFDINAMTLYGNWAVYSSGNTTDLISGSYSCSLVTSKAK
jgi:hypothetical protein